MGLFDLTDLVVQRGMQGASLQQQVLSNNLANENTAGFKAGLLARNVPDCRSSPTGRFE